MCGFIQQEFEILQGRGRPGFQRTWRDRVNADAPRAEFIGQIAARGLQRRLDWASSPEEAAACDPI